MNIQNSKIFSKISIHFWTVVLCVSLLWLNGEKALGQQDSFEKIVSSYQEKMQEAARSWLKKHYAIALDGFYSADQLLSKNMVSPSETYTWNGLRTLKTYTLVLIRLVQIDLYRSQDQNKLLASIVKQASDWAELLKEEVDAWRKVKITDPDAVVLRMRWMRRCQAAIRRTQKISQEFESKK